MNTNNPSPKLMVLEYSATNQGRAGTSGPALVLAEYSRTTDLGYKIAQSGGG